MQREVETIYGEFEYKCKTDDAIKRKSRAKLLFLAASYDRLGRGLALDRPPVIILHAPSLTSVFHGVRMIAKASANRLPQI